MRPPLSAESFFSWLGRMIGEGLRLLIDALSGVLSAVRHALHDFFRGLSRALGVQDSTLGIVLILLGILLLYAGFRALSRRAWLAGGLWLLLGLALMSWLIR
jgi:uncharacterized membrane protein YidH (DUF202 family)